MHCARPEGGVAEVEGQAAVVRAVRVPERLGAQRPRRVRHLEEGDRGEEDGHECGQPARLSPRLLAPEGEAVGRVVREDHERDDREPEAGHQDRAREEEAPVEDLHEQERGNAEGHRGGDRDREGVVEEGEERRAV
jgi:hypothetical protein